MSDSSVYDLFFKMDADKIVLAYKGDINNELLEAVYAMMDKHLEEKKAKPDVKKKFFHILTESLQNVFHHKSNGKIEDKDFAMTGFAIRNDAENTYRIITGNYILNSSVDGLQSRIEKVNKMNAEDLRTYYKESLAGNEFSDKGGAGLGIIEMARKSGNNLSYEFRKVNEQYSFFILTITI